MSTETPSALSLLELEREQVAARIRELEAIPNELKDLRATHAKLGRAISVLEPVKPKRPRAPKGKPAQVVAAILEANPEASEKVIIDTTVAEGVSRAAAKKALAIARDTLPTPA